MIRDDVLKWGSILLLAVFAFMFLPAQEHFTSSYKRKSVYDERGRDFPHFEYSPGPSRSDPPVDDILGGDKADRSDGSRAGAGHGPGVMDDRYRKVAAPKPWFIATPEDNYVEKSSLVPCTCTIHTMGCPKHAGSRDYSEAPGDQDYDNESSSMRRRRWRLSNDEPTPDQYDIMKPFSSSFVNQGEPSGFLNTFNAFMH